MSNDATPIPLLELVTEIDERWVESVLTLEYPDARVRGITRTPIGAGNVSDTVLIEIDYDHHPDDAPDRVVAKLRPSAPEVHEHGLGSGAYHREIGAYRTITKRAACRIPRLFHVAGDESNINLVIEDLTSAAPGDQVTGCGVLEAEAVLTQLARLHAAYFPQESATAPAWPIRMPEVADYWARATRAGAEQALERYRDRLTRTDLDLIGAVVDVVHDWHHLPQPRLTLSHGDPRVDNVLFEQVGGRINAVLIDWQVTGLRNPMYDVGYFLSGSLSVTERRDHEDRLLAHYLREFAAVRPGYDEADARNDYRTQVLSGLVITTAAIAVLPDNDIVNRLILALLERNCAAVHDWDSIVATRDCAAATHARPLRRTHAPGAE